MSAPRVTCFGLKNDFWAVAASPWAVPSDRLTVVARGWSRPIDWRALYAMSADTVDQKNRDNTLNNSATLALLATDAEVAVHAAQRQPLAAGLLEARLRRRHARSSGEDYTRSSASSVGSDVLPPLSVKIRQPGAKIRQKTNLSILGQICSRLGGILPRRAGPQGPCGPTKDTIPALSGMH